MPLRWARCGTGYKDRDYHLRAYDNGYLFGSFNGFSKFSGRENIVVPVKLTDFRGVVQDDKGVSWKTSSDKILHILKCRNRAMETVYFDWRGECSDSSTVRNYSLQIIVWLHRTITD